MKTILIYQPSQGYFTYFVMFKVKEYSFGIDIGGNIM